MDIRYTPSLVEGVVLEAIQRQDAIGEYALSAEYHRLVDPIYEMPSIEREAQFNTVHHRLFLDWGFGKIVQQALDEYPDLIGRVEGVVVTTAPRREEGADLSQGGGQHPSLPAIVIKVRPDRFFDRRGTQRFLRHELMHVQDMLDPSFEYTPESGLLSGSPTEMNMLKDRYRMLWDLSIDGRLIRNGRETVSSQDERRSEFKTFYRKFPPVQTDAIFERIWQMDRPPHAELLAMARNIQVLLEQTGMTEVVARPGMCTPMPGAPCPLCRFPTFTWADEVEQLPAEVLDAVRSDYPDWTPEDGACERCLEAYQARVGLWL